jgi:hypothetical protein
MDAARLRRVLVRRPVGSEYDIAVLLVELCVLDAG